MPCWPIEKSLNPVRPVACVVVEVRVPFVVAVQVPPVFLRTMKLAVFPAAAGSTSVGSKVSVMS
jgi:hypothetical protein